MPGKVLSSEEIRLIKDWYVNEEKAPSEIAFLLKRDKSTITRFLKSLNGSKKRRRRGRHAALTTAQVDKLEKKLADMIKQANGRKEITLAALKKRARCKASEVTIRRALHARDIYFYAMRWKPLLTKEDVEGRYAFGKKFGKKPSDWWKKNVQMKIDVKFFPIYLHGRARAHAAQTGCRGVYRKYGEGLSVGYYKPNPKMKYNTGAKGIHVLAGVGNGKVLLWEHIQGNWNAKEAERIYRGPMLAALKKEYPTLHRFKVLEDNDPTGFRSKRGMQAKEDVGT